MEDIIATGIDGKHSNEDAIAPFSTWVNLYGDRICNLGGIDMNVLCLKNEAEIREIVFRTIEESVGHGGFALGSGNSIPDYVPVEGFLAMNRAANEFRCSQMRVV
jgi:uroporphyrinogen decarboxylase